MENEKVRKRVPSTLERMKNIAKSTNALKIPKISSQHVPRNTRSSTGVDNLGVIPTCANSDGNIPNGMIEGNSIVGMSFSMSVKEANEDFSPNQFIEEGVHLSRKISKSVGDLDFLNNVSFQYVLVRSKDTFSIPFSAFLNSEKDMKRAVSRKFPKIGDTQLVESVENLTKSVELVEKESASVVFSHEDLIIAEDGFLRDIQMKGFTGIWCHPTTSLYFLMYLISKRMDNLYVIIINKVFAI
jgi:hypothetical protein